MLTVPLDNLGIQSFCASSILLLSVSLLFFPSAFPHLHAWCYCQYSTCFRKEAPLHRWVKTRSGGNLKSRRVACSPMLWGYSTPLLSSTGMSSSPLPLCSSVPQVSASPTASKPLHTPPQCPPRSPFRLRTPLSNTPLILSSSCPPVAPPHPHLRILWTSPPTFQLLLYPFLWILPRRCCLDFSHWFLLVQPGTKNQRLRTPEPEHAQG